MAHGISALLGFRDQCVLKGHLDFGEFFRLAIHTSAMGNKSVLGMHHYWPVSPTGMDFFSRSVHATTTLWPFSNHALPSPWKSARPRTFLPRLGRRSIAAPRPGLCEDQTWLAMLTPHREPARRRPAYARKASSHRSESELPHRLASHIGGSAHGLREYAG